jgi:excisionase family DNA binding protein
MSHDDTVPATMTVREMAARTGLGVGSAYKVVREGGVPTIRLGRRILVLRQPLEDMLAGREWSRPEAR